MGVAAFFIPYISHERPPFYYLCNMKRRQISILGFLVVGLAFFFWNNDKTEFISNQGLIFGTTYSMIYDSPEGIDHGDEMRQHLLEVVDNSLSTFNKKSTISLINNNVEHKTDPAFEAVYQEAVHISKITDGAFDMTVAPLVNTWGFGYKNKDEVIPPADEIAALLDIVGYEKIRLKNHQIIKDYPETKLDASAIAKGYSVDVAARFLESKGISNFMVEIGGEIRVSGENTHGKKWRLGIDQPIEDLTLAHRAIDTVLHMTDMALATSGNYRQFYYKDGKRYSHTIDPISGYPVNHTLLSATVLAKNCMTADALATACMVMGAEKSLKLAEELEGVEVYLIIDNEGATQEVFSAGLKDFLHP